MPKFDVAIGMDHTTLDTGVAQLYADPDARNKLFKGEDSGTTNNLPYTVSFDVQAAPLFSLAPDPAITALWPKSIDNTGKNPSGPLPSPNLFVLTLPKFEAQLTIGKAKPLSGTADNVRVFCTLAVASNIVTLTPVSIWIDESHMTGFDKLIINQMLKRVLLKIQTLLAGLKIPPLSFSKEGITVDLTPPVASIVGGRLVAAACLTSNGTPDIGGATWPDKSLFALVSGGAITSILQQALNSKVVNQEMSASGSIKVASWDATAKCSSATVTSDATDRTKVSATIGFGLSAELKPLGIGGPCAIGAATSGM
jgi:hypothetical protein